MIIDTSSPESICRRALGPAIKDLIFKVIGWKPVNIFAYFCALVPNQLVAVSMEPEA